MDDFAFTKQNFDFFITGVRTDIEKRAKFEYVSKKYSGSWVVHRTLNLSQEVLHELYQTKQQCLNKQLTRMQNTPDFVLDIELAALVDAVEEHFGIFWRFFIEEHDDQGLFNRSSATNVHREVFMINLPYQSFEIFPNSHSIQYIEWEWCIHGWGQMVMPFANVEFRSPFNVSL